MIQNDNEEFIIKLNKTARFMDGVKLMDNQDVVVLVTSIYESSFQIYNRSSELLKQFNYKGQILGFKYLENDAVFFMMTESGYIGYINFRTRQQLSWKFQFRKPSIYWSKLYVFPETQTYAIYEQADSNSKTARFTFFKYPCEQFWQTEVENGFNLHVNNANHSGKLALFKARMEEMIEFNILDGHRKEVMYYTAQKPGNAQFIVKSIHELTQNQFLLHCDSSAADKRNLVFDCKRYLLGETDIIRNFRYNVPEKVYEIQNGKDFLYFFQFDIDSVTGKELECPILLISKQTQQLVHQSRCIITHGLDYELSTEGQQRMMAIKYQYHYCKEITIRSEKVVSQKELYMFMLKKLGKFSTNSLQNVVESLQYD